ncbi:MAG TPA: LacI family DNA-binding transcriptional regulator [Phototrophicaceae bacterium]|nr:LacI family DNA-binding transcriptional regulator [Phototrophicaceae bacterium]
MSTIGDVARRAGVSTMTVSRVINNSGYISQETRERVEQAIAELGYVPNALARSLRFKQTKTIALIITDITNPFFTTVARGVEDTASEHGFSVIFCNTDESQDEESDYLTLMVQKQVDGIILVPAHSSRASAAFLQDHKVPFVVLDRRIAGMELDTVRCDSEIGGYQLTRHLIDLGHRRIAMLSGPLLVSTSADRLAGYRRALDEAGLEHAEFFGSLSNADGYRMAREALTAPQRPTAFFAANNLVAIGALRALLEQGIRVPQDLSVVSYDDLPESMIFDPFLTVVAQPAYDMGQQATRLLLNRLSGIDTTAPREVLLPAPIIARKSSAAPPGTNP